MKRTVFVFVLTLAAVLALSQFVLGADMIVGTWKQNMAQSKYSPANLAPKSGTMTKIEAMAGGVKVTADGVDNEGRKTHTEYTATFDGKEARVTATIDGKVSPNQDAVVWKKIDDYTYENIAKLKGQTLTTTRMVVSKDGKTRTNTVTGKNAQGQTVSNTVVYDRQ